MSKKKLIYNISIVLIVALISYVFVSQFMRNSDFSWTFSQNEYWNAILEVFLLFWLYYFGLKIKSLPRVGRIVLISLVMATTLFLHSMIWAMAVVLLYFVSVYLLGNGVCRLFKKMLPNLKDDFVCNTVIGITSVIAIVSVLSIFGLARPNMLRWILGAILLIVSAVNWKGARDLAKHIKETYLSLDEKTDKIDSLVVALSLSMLTAVFCRANLCTDYDSLWYGLRSEYVLAPYGGIFDRVTLLGCVHTYPKAFETFTLVFGGLKSYSFTIGINIIMLILLIDVAVKSVRLFIKNRNVINLLILFVLLTPSITGMAVTAKPDLMSVYIQLAAIYFAIYGLKTKANGYLPLCIACLFFSFGIKSTSILFSSIIFVITVVFLIVNRYKLRIKDFLVIVIPTIATLFMFARTYILTGMPMTSLVVSILLKFGFKIKAPYTLVSSRTTSIKDLVFSGLLWKRIARLPKLFFYPNTSDLVTTERTWWGVLYSFIFIFTLLLIIVNIKKVVAFAKENKAFAFAFWNFIVCSILSMASMLLLDMPDGNYFMLMQMLNYSVLGVVIAQFDHKPDILLIWPLVLCNILLSIGISSSWCVGFTPIDIKSWGFYDHSVKYTQSVINRNHIVDLYSYLTDANEDRVQHIILLSDMEDPMFSLPGMIENYYHVGEWGDDYFDSKEKAEFLIDSSDVDILIQDIPYTEGIESIINIIRELQREGKIYKGFDDGTYVVWIVNRDSGSNMLLDAAELKMFQRGVLATD